MRSKFKWIFTLLVALTMQFSFAQKTVTGKVSDASGPLPGANIVVKGTKNATSTDFDGTYSIKAKEGDVLVFSFVEKESKVATVGAGNVYNATLNATELTTVVVTGALGIKRTKNSVTSSQQTVSNKELTQAANPNVIQSLAGKVSGLQISTTASGVNAGTRIVIRGLRTITGNAEALVVIDNAISSAAILQQLPPEVIENVNVIKGQQGSALYGEQGSNGVIIVTTKKGSGSSKPVISINSSLDFENIAFLPERQVKYGQGWHSDPNFFNGTVPAAQSNNVPFENGSWGAAYDDPRYAGTLQPTGLPQADGKFLLLPYKGNSDNIKKFFKTGTLFQNGVSLNMGGEDGYVFISANRQNTDFIIDGDKLTRTSFLFKGGKKIGKFTLGGNVNYSVESVSNTDTSLYFDLLNTATNIPIELFSAGVNGNHWTAYNKSPYWKQRNQRFDNLANNLNASFNFGYEFNKNINISYTLNGLFRNSVNEYHNNGDTFDAAYNTGGPYTYGGNPLDFYSSFAPSVNIVSQYFNSTITRQNIYSDLLLNFDYKLTKDVGFKLNIGNNIQDVRLNQSTTGGLGLNTPGLYNANNVSNPGAVIQDANSDASFTPFQFYDGTFGNKLINRKTIIRRVAFFANTDFNYKDYLFLNATARYEQTSNIKGSQFYPGVGLSFIPTLAFEGLKGSSILNYAKLTASYSVAGNTTPAGYADTAGPVGFLPTGYPFNGVFSFTSPGNQTFEGLRAEFVNSYEVGLALGFLKDRITIGATYYNSKTKDLITNQTTSAASGLNSLRRNIGDLENTGFDFDFGVSPVKGNFKWDIKTNLSFNKSIITALADGQTEISLNPAPGAGVFAIVGEQFPFLKASTFLRDANGNVVVGTNGTPLLTPGGLQKYGKVAPDYILGITNSFEFKGLKLTAVIDYRSGGKIYSRTKRDLNFTGNTLESAEFDRTKGFVFPGSVQINGAGVSIPNVTPVNNGANYTTAGSYFSNTYINVGETSIVDATSFRLREIALSYSLPSKMIESVGLSSFRVGVNARNLLTLLGDPFKSRSTYQNQGFADPETSDAGINQRNSNATGIQDQVQYPSTKTIGFSINLTF